jgi:predicted RecA/RadA family phage recombinase
MVRFIHDGRSIDYKPSEAVTAGDIVVQGDLIGIAKIDIAANALGALAIEGVFDFPKAAGEGSGIAAGTNVYWDATNKVATATAGTNKLIGKTVIAAADADTTVRAKLNQ